MLPFRLAKMKEAVVPPTRKDMMALFCTWPVGAGTVTGARGTVTTPEAVTVYSAELAAAASETQKGLAPLKETPHGFLRLGSVKLARPGMSDTRLVCT